MVLQTEEGGAEPHQPSDDVKALYRQIGALRDELREKEVLRRRVETQAAEIQRQVSAAGLCLRCPDGLRTLRDILGDAWASCRLTHLRGDLSGDLSGAAAE